MKSKHLLPIFILALALATGSLALADECLECHKDPAFKVQDPKLYNYYVNFDNSVHGIAGLSCVECHGGDPDTTDLDLAHENVLAPVKFDQIPITCGQCHIDQRDAFVTSNHYRILKADGTAPNCATCHGAMEMDYISVTRVKGTCLYCHNKESGVLPDVPATADKVLNQINIIKGYRNYVAIYAKDRELVAVLDDAYNALSANWHSFNLASVEHDTEELLGAYRRAKAQAVKDRKIKD